MKHKLYLIPALASLLAMAFVNTKSSVEKTFTSEQIQNIEALTSLENDGFPCISSPSRACFLYAEDANHRPGILRIDGMVHI